MKSIMVDFRNDMMVQFRALVPVLNNILSPCALPSASFSSLSSCFLRRVAGSGGGLGQRDTWIFTIITLKLKTFSDFYYDIL